MYVFSVILRIWLLVLGAYIVFIGPASSKPGRDFPEKSAIQYSTGTLKPLRVSARGSQVATIVLVPEGKLAGTAYYCAYAADQNPNAAWCMSKKKAEQYNGKTATVGWYMQKDFLWFHNPHPQLVSLEVDGKMVTSYEDTVKFIDRLNSNVLNTFWKFFSYIVILPGFAISIAYLTVAGRAAKRGEIDWWTNHKS